MYGSRLVSAVAAVFAAIAVLFAIFGFAANVGFFAVAALFGAVAYFMWYHASGRFAQRLYRGVEERAAPGGSGRGGRGGFGAGPREEWEPPRDEDASGRQRARTARGGQARGGGRQRRQARAQGQRRRRRAAAAAQPSGPTAAEAYDTLDLNRDADEDAVKAAYREKVKEVHPDSPDGDEEAFKEVQSAYERLTGD
ncbi:J domain-containing protein [Halosimplex rubrum]|uniref:J domain-containing protein n=1 Tax=Halosimplex rubrum TaxID=869889 RepID=A0A7D5P5U8_9EURY|nr:J domain-containing protein [Halosimplex rubrum]QLH78102.1 J domain-containing protein [Halosimplex rubrum]